MIAEYIRYALPANRANDLVGAYERASKWLDASPHCLGYELARCTDDPAKYILRIEWDSHDGHLKGFRSSEEFKGFYRDISDFIPFIEEMRHYDLTGVTGRKNATMLA
jgi:heme-degrading monooxygenase HmoA